MFQKMTDMIQKKEKVKNYGRVLTNKMTIVAWKLFKSNQLLHFAFILMRMKKDFGFTDWEIANFTGMPLQHINKIIKESSIHKILESEILQVMAKKDIEGEFQAWRELPDTRGGKQGMYYHDLPEWYNPLLEGRYMRRLHGPPTVTVGQESEEEYEKKDRSAYRRFKPEEPGFSGTESERTERS